MIWALVGLIVLILIVVLTVGFLALQTVSQTLSNALLTLERVHTNDGHRIDTVLDRLMAQDFEAFKSFQIAEEAEEGGVDYGDEDEPVVRLEIPGKTHALGYTDLEAAAAEARILMEDFPPEKTAEA